MGLVLIPGKGQNDPVDMLGHMQRGSQTMGFNRYAYANNNPYKFTDPDGRYGIGAYQAMSGNAGILRGQYASQNADPSKVASAQISEARDTLQATADVAGIAGIAATALQPVIGGPLLAVSATAGVAAAALSDDPAKNVAIEVATNVGPGKALDAAATISKGVMKAADGSGVSTAVDTVKEVSSKVYGDQLKEEMQQEVKEK